MVTIDTRVQVAIAILYQEDRFLLQLRDNIPNILYPGYWCLFGGHLDPGETPEQAVVREIKEEINYELPVVQKFGIVADERVIRHVFHAPLLQELSELTLAEGWDWGLASLEEIRIGSRYSEQAAQVRPLGPPHQKLLLEFAEQSSIGK
ncbi:MAG: NUDIX hydrolase [Synechococcales bacterium]|nr:NUDIX hydrolase [Synechococcales bacterium]